MIHSQPKQALNPKSRQISLSVPLHCRHCGTDVPLGEQEFCCRGCRTAFQLINALGLENFYSTAGRMAQKPRELAETEDFAALDCADFIAGYTTVDEAGHRVARLQLDGLHCYACVWLCETAVTRVMPQARCEVNLALGVARITYPPDTVALSRIALLLRQLGYPPTPLAVGVRASPQPEILRLGVAVFCTMNVMSFALVDYFSVAGDPANSVDPPVTLLLRWLSLALASLTLAYSAAPLYRSALAGIRGRRPTIDMGVTAGLSAAFAYSAWNTWLGTGPIYFDSVTAVVALLLTGRIVQRQMLAKIEQSLLGAGATNLGLVRRPTFSSAAANLAEPSRGGTAPSAAEQEFMTLTAVKRGDLFRVMPGEVVPLGADIVSGGGEVSLEQLTGEAAPISLRPGQRLRAGSINRSEPLILRACEDGSSCYLSQTQRLAERLLAEKGSYAALSDRLAGYFFYVALALAAVAFAFGLRLSPEAAVARTVAVLLVACPCVFGYAAPLVLATCGVKGLAAGVAFRSQRAIESLATVGQAVFDKTGTLSLGQPSVHQAVLSQAALARVGITTIDLHLAILLLAKTSNHHATQAVAAWAHSALPETAGKPALMGYDMHEDLGEGVAARTLAHVFRLGRRDYAQTCAASTPGIATAESSPPVIDTETKPQPEVSGGAGDAQVYLTVDGTEVARFSLSDQLRPEATGVVRWLTKLGVKPSIMSGDRGEQTAAAAATLGMSTWVGDLTPAGKALGVKRLVGKTTVAMIGNGFNDSVAMAQATVGIAVFGSGNAAQRTAEVCLLTPGLTALPAAFKLARAARWAVLRCFAFAASYNLMAIFLAATGYVSPVVAAVLMPINSLFVTLIATRWRVHSEDFVAPVPGSGSALSGAGLGAKALVVP